MMSKFSKESCMEHILEVLQKIENKPLTDNLTSQIPYLLEQIEDERIKNIVIPELAAIENDIENIIFSKIKMCKNLQEAKSYFELLQKIQEILAHLAFKDKIEISEKLLKFTKDFDRIDDICTREDLFRQVKIGQYSL
jgi:ribosome-binding factor A